MKLFSMRYYVGREGDVPYGYAPLETGTDLPEGVGLYEDTSALPLVYTYDKTITEEEFAELDPAQKQEAMLQAVVLKESGLPKASLQFHSGTVSYEAVEENGVRLGRGRIFMCLEKEGSLVLEIEGAPLCETYVALTGLQYEGLDRTDRMLFEDSTITEGSIVGEDRRGRGVGHPGFKPSFPQEPVPGRPEQLYDGPGLPGGRGEADPLGLRGARGNTLSRSWRWSARRWSR